jgi:hypothetical protein
MIGEGTKRSSGIVFFWMKIQFQPIELYLTTIQGPTFDTGCVSVSDYANSAKELMETFQSSSETYRLYGGRSDFPHQLSGLNFVGARGRQTEFKERKWVAETKFYSLPINHLHKGKKLTLSPEYFSSAL